MKQPPLTDTDLQSIIHGAEGIFRALNIIDDPASIETRQPKDLSEVRTLLIVAGEQLCKLASEAF